MKFGLEKCAAMTMKWGKRVHSDGIALPDGTQLRALGEEESYLGVLEADHVLHEESKERLKKEYIRRVKKCLKSKLNGGNMVKDDQHLGCVADEVQCGNCRVGLWQI